ncbi:neuropeptides capa receptor isoform X2 [Calliopsis andreniformis]|uniref:neuropeptides capa receptor isoform X2 n=1 Tax=Calliopsis andreniformis TaxID=337506 RepID=UPI003FCD90CF
MNVWDEYYDSFVDPNETEYLREKRGPKYLPAILVLPLTLAYVIIFVTGIAGNLITFIVIIKNTNMQNVTNYYLFNLAVSDVLFLIFGLPSELSVYWQQYPWKLGLVMCKLRAYVSEMCSYVSVLTIVLFSLERYMAICHPLRQYTSGLERSIYCILAAWLLALMLALPFYVYTDINFLYYPPESEKRKRLEESAMCMPVMPKFPLYQVSCVLFFLLPMVFIAVLYVRMGLRIQSSSLEHTIEGSVHGEGHAQSRRIIIRMLSVVVIAFFICWAPFHTQRLLYVYLREDPKFDMINQWLYPVSGCLYYLSTTINPILYNAMSAKYRNAFKEILCCKIDHSSMRDSSTICGPVSRRESQHITNNYTYQRSISTDAVLQAEEKMYKQ